MEGSCYFVFFGILLGFDGMVAEDRTQELSFPAGCGLSWVVAHIESIFGVLHDAFEYLGLCRDGRNQSVYSYIYLAQPELTMYISPFGLVLRFRNLRVRLGCIDGVTDPQVWLILEYA